ncbi:hypothetical protein [Pararhizobium antarcticum]|uniref:hypothetical protein n=1 Tax=Pararhizobium antarcticum TaxID=1798805 RepID=UPI00158703A5|nr:hypothetical protein [Pararhizobium antarcticum]
MIDTFVIDHLLVAKEQIEEIMLHLPPRRPASPEISGFFDARAENTIAAECRLNRAFRLHSPRRAGGGRIDQHGIVARKRPDCGNSRRISAVFS